MPRRTILKAETHYHAETSKDFPVIEHRHPWHEVVGVVNGVYEVEVDGQRLRGESGQFFYYPPGLPHRSFVSTRSEMVMHLLQWREAGDGRQRPRTWFDTTGRWLQTAAWMVELGTLPPTIGRSAMHGLLSALLVGLDHPDVVTDDGGISPPITRLRIYLRTRLNERLTLTGLAKIAHLSREGLLRRWRREVGLTPMADLRAMRLEAARNLLRSTRCTQAEAARRCGFTDAAHLNRWLRAQA